MAAATFMSVVPDLEPGMRTTGQEYLQWVSDFVSTYKFKKLSLKKPARATLTICKLEDTDYMHRPDVVTGWGQFYLPDIVTMQVVGVVEGISCYAGQLVLMTCEDKKLYGYDEFEGAGELHVVASDLDRVIRDGIIDYPASESYYDGEAFKNMTEEDWKEVKRGPVGRRLEEEYNRKMQETKDSFLQRLKELEQRLS